MSEVYLPSLPKFKVTEAEQDFDLAQATFTLSYGSLDVLCCIKGVVKVEQFDCSPSDGNVQNSIERDFKYLVVGETEVSIDQTDIDLVEGQKIELTEKQIEELNSILKDMMELV